MLLNNSNPPYRKVGTTACYMVFGFGIFYAIVTTIGLLTLKSPQDPIGYPYFTIMEMMSILIALLMTISMAAVHQYALQADKVFSLLSLIFMSVTTGITSCVHFLVLSVSNSAEAKLLSHHSLYFSFKWPSVVYALDILAWDLFFGISMLFAAPVFKRNLSEKKINILLISCGIFSLIGLMGVPLQNMQLRNIGIIGYAVIAPVAFLFIGKILGQANHEKNKNLNEV